jgi:ubiquinone/menaquinone biosynthesis C-methylase UbiE
VGILDRFRKAKHAGSSHAATPDLPAIRDFFNQAAADEEHYPSVIDPRILHVRRVLDHLGDMNGRVAADIGSGKGRFARIVKDRNPGATVIALDLAEAMLRPIATDIRRVSASMTQLPLASGSVDGAYAIESLEHAIDIEGAVAELTRIVRPGGKVAIIDKNIEKWGQLETPEWEQWFDQRAINRLLERSCRDVVSEPISYWDDIPADGLFFIWLAVKA